MARSGMTTYLSNLNIIITRPESQSESLKNKILALHGNPILFPTITIASFEKNDPLQDVLTHINKYDIAVFVSINAVQNVAPSWPHHSKLKIAAIGKSTARALQKYHISVDYFPDEIFNSESLLDLPVFQKVTGKNILLFSGEGGRNFLQDTLQNRGARVTKIPVYQRIMPQINVAIPYIMNSSHEFIIVVTSNESLLNLIKMFSKPFLQDWLYKIPILVISSRIHRYALELGFNPSLLILAKNATDEAILDALIKWYSYHFTK